ncbi:MAG: F420-0:Gamma-glutamyl ligase [Cyanobacteriota bacterium]|nr:F420-0:Gamma-glutamyl ligase [Cyanobacteriota bacterium]
MAIAQTLGIGITAASALLGFAFGAIEYQYRKRPKKQLELTQGTWNLEKIDPQRYLLVGELELVNLSPARIIIVPELSVEVQLFSDASCEEITCNTQIVPLHDDEPAREDGYWMAYLLKPKKTTRVKISIDIQGPNLDKLEAAWIMVNYIAYGAAGRIPQIRNVVFPFQYPDPNTPAEWKAKEGVTVLPIKTHLLNPLDDIVEIIERYVSPHSQPGDIVTIGESPLAIMQEQMKLPEEMELGWVARRLCHYFGRDSSLGVAYGLQSLVDEVGAARVVFALSVGVVAKALGRPGVFYQLAGEQARLIDDLTGTSLPPYDRFIVLGPIDSTQVVTQIQQKTGLSAAIVDVNDLEAVKILASTPDVSADLLEAALRSNPAGNAAEQTPLVLIRPTS